ncbi:MAG: glutathione S-transferase N-terminal domain-containing protein [Alphaproteobacteria bacterium]|nr:glutathione S-transferase N-terminal domain-containing protein [Alphaproteobacteria bacterium]
MKLYSFSTSPYVRKVLIMAHETGLIDQIEQIETPVYQQDSYRKTNPLGKIPALMPADGGKVLYDSFVICDYLDHLHDGPKMLPLSGAQRYEVLRLHALSNGIIDAALNLRVQMMRNDQLSEKIPEDWYFDRQVAAINAGIDDLEQQVEILGAPVNLGIITTGAMLGYLDFRLDQMNWRDLRPNLASWFEAFSERDSMKATLPKE